MSWGCELCGRPEKLDRLRGPSNPENDGHDEQRRREEEQKLREARKEVRNCRCESNPSFEGSVWWDRELKRCPWSQISLDTWQLVDLWQTWKMTKLLPYAGELADQPAWVMDAIVVCEAAQVEAQSIRFEHMRAEAGN